MSELAALMEQHGTDYPAIAAALGIKVNAARDRCRRLRQKLADPPATEDYPDARTVESDPLPRIVTLDALLANANIDLAVWDVERFVVNKWEVGAKDPRGRIIVEPLYQVKAWLVRNAMADRLVELRAGILADIRAEAVAPLRLARTAIASPAARHMLEVSAFDLHFGKLAWGQETGGPDYDVSIARECFMAAVEDLMQKAAGFPLQRILLPIGNDLLQTDNLAGTTTGGTPQDTDSRYVKAFRHARSALAWAVQRLATVAPVLVIVVPGNHDRLTAFHMGEVLAAQFADDPRVTVDNSPKLRKYVPFGVNLLGFTHGSEEKHADLPLIMAREEPDAWAVAKHYEWHVGHLHKSKETRYTAGDSFNGVRVRILPSLCATDAWHYSRGYVGERRSCEGYLWNFATGYAGHLAANILPAERAAMVA